MRARTVLLAVAALSACTSHGASSTSSSSTAAPSASAPDNATPPSRPGDAIQGLFAIATPESEAARRGYEARIAAAKTESEAATARMEAALNADFLRAQATIRRGRLVLKRSEKVVLEASYRVERADAAAVDVVLDVDGGAACRFELIAPDRLRVPSLEGLAGGAIWVRQVTRD